MYKELEKIIKDTFTLYTKAKVCILKNNNKIIELKHGKEIIRLSCENYIKLVDFVLNNLDQQDKFILENNFYKDNKESYWWSRYFSKSSYYRVSKKAYINFLNYLFF